MKQEKPIWIGEQEAATLAGLDPKTFRRYVTGKNPQLRGIDYTKLTRKAEVKYNKLDIERLLIESSRTAA
jgi:hypothetical protein